MRAQPPTRFFDNFKGEAKKGLQFLRHALQCVYMCVFVCVCVCVCVSVCVSKRERE